MAKILKSRKIGRSGVAVLARFRRPVLWLVPLAMTCASFAAGAQMSKPSSLPAIMDKGVLAPPSTPSPSARQDPTALAIIRSFQRSVGPADWKDLEARGKISPAASQRDGITTTQNFHLWLLGHKSSRLDIQTPRGSISIRIDGIVGGIQQPNGHIFQMDPRDAATGLFAFPEIESADFPFRGTSLIDRGMVNVDGVSLHRITAEVPWRGLAENGKPTSGIGITDLYFDPTTHLLVKSVNTLQGTDTRLAKFVRVITYSNYRSVDNMTVPFHVSESLQGRPVWVLDIQHVEFNQPLSESQFAFH